VGLTCVLTTDRAVPGGRLAAVAGQRLILPLPDRADYAVAGIPAREIPGHRPPGRALLGEEALECQLALPRPLPTAAAVTVAAVSAAPSGTAPLRIADLPPDPSVDLPGTTLVSPTGAVDPSPLLLPIGPGGDEGRCVTVDLLRLGGLLVTGPPGSGRSAALEAFARHLRATGTPVLRLEQAPGSSPGGDLDVDRLECGDAVGVGAWLSGVAGRRGVVIADDVGAPGECPALSSLTVLGVRSGIALLAAATPGQLSGHYQGPIAALRRNRSGLLLCPGPGDADLLGIRLPRTPLPVRPGSGWLVTGATADRVQVARRRVAVTAPTGAGTGPG
jgi:S-DNA-T family DNA segregation ATPase FtsK/SpoIIIE